MPARAIPGEVLQMLQQGAAVFCSLSGGKDSQASAAILAHQLDLVGLAYGTRVRAIHADLGRVEWPQSMAMCRRISSQHGWDLDTVRRAAGDLVDQVVARAEKLAGTGQPFWPSSAARYCTSDQKRDQIDKAYRACGSELIISVEGLRADESARRARMAPVQMRKRITAKRLRSMTISQAIQERRPGERLAITWLNIHDFSIDDVWHACGTTAAELERRRALWAAGDAVEALVAWPAHVAYVMGNERVSCMLCIMGCKGDLINGIRHGSREVLRTYVELERAHGFTFKQDTSLDELARSIGVEV